MGRLRWLGAPSLLACVAAVAGACASDQSDESVGFAQQAATATNVLLNEVLYDPPGNAATDDAHQYIEISGSANGTLEGYYVVVVDGRNAGSPGAVLSAVALGTACSGACAIGSNGQLVITPAATGGFAFPTGTTRVASGYTMDNNANIGTDDYSILLISSSVAIAVGADFDTANNGTLTLPTGATLVDAVGWTESTTGFVYGGVNVTPGTAAKDSPDAIIRIAGNTTPLTRNAWFYAEISGTSSSGTTLTGATASGTGAIPTGVTAITPGLPNTAASIIPVGTAGAAGTAGTAGAAAGSGNSGGTAGASQVGNAGNAGNAGTAGQLIIVLPEIGGAPSTGGAATAGTTGIPATGGAATAGSTGLSSGGAVSAGAPSIGGAVGTAGTANAAGNPGQAGLPSTTGTAGAESSLAGSAGIAAGKGGSGGVVNTAKGGVSATVGGSGGTATAVGGTATAVGGKAAGIGGKAAGIGGKAASVGGGTGNGDTTAAEDDESSCGCRIVGREKSRVSGLAMVMALAGALLSRRRRRG